MIERVWPGPGGPPGPALLAGAGAAGAVAALTMSSEQLGINVPLTAAAMLAVLVPAAWSAGRVLRPARGAERWDGRLNRTGLGFALAALALLGTAALRDADWVVGLCLVLAVPVASYAATGGRSWTEVLGGGLILPAAVLRMLPWAGGGVSALARRDRTRTGPLLRAGLAAAGLLLVFGGLFAGADAAFREVVVRLVPEADLGSWPLRALLWTVFAAVTLALVLLLRAPAPLHRFVPRPVEPAGRWAWAVPLVALDLLFIAFCSVQATVLLADDKDRLLRSTGLTYAEYAREGFFQLVLVTVLVLVVVAVAARYAPRATGGDRTLVRGLLGLLCALTLVVVAVALRRLFLYEEAFGWTELRLWVHAFELWLGLVVVMVMAAGLAGRAGWLPRAVALSGAAALLALAALNPDGFIAERNVARYEQTGEIDVYHLSGLSADAVPALAALPEPYRSCALRPIEVRLDRDGDWRGANLSRHRAREVLRGLRPSEKTCEVASSGDRP